MNWLKEHSYIGTWLSPCIAVILAVVKSKGNVESIDLYELMLVFLLLSSFAIAVNPAFDTVARNLAETVLFFSFGALAVGSRRRQ